MTVHGGNRRQCGFTLIEVLIVMTLIGIILGIGIPNLRRSMVRAEMLGQAGMIQQSIGVSRIFAIKNSSQVALQFLPDDAPIEGYEIHSWVDANANGAADAGEEIVGRWPMTGKISIDTEAGNTSHTLHPLAGNALGVVFFANGTAMVHDNQIGTGQGAVVLEDSPGNRLRVTIQGGSGSVLTDMWKSESGEWTESPWNFWRY